ncbi:MAG: rhodanese-related sulfurtransferase [Pseudomonadota bacterium]
MPTRSQDVLVCALYKFVALPDYRNLQPQLLSVMLDNQVRGTLLLASEGLNGTVAGSPEPVGKLIDWIRRQPSLQDIEVKESYANALPFKRSKVKLKKEIVTMGIDGIDPEQSAGTYVNPSDWNALIDDPEVKVIDTRNEYEIRVGTFSNAINPHTTNFREFPDFADEHLDPERDKKIAMFCTGGIRCEKSTAYLKQQGFDEVYHLKGGILKYLEDTDERDSRWQGECFVFDQRVTVDHNLDPGKYDQCHACRLPISDDDKRHENYVAGVSCPYCWDRRSDADRKRYAEREKQMELASIRGEDHFGRRYDVGAQRIKNKEKTR